MTIAAAGHDARNRQQASAARIVLCAGEASGDQLGGSLIQALRERLPQAEFAGIGGQAMYAAGLRVWHSADALAVMGLAEVLRDLPRLLRLRTRFRRQTLAWRPDLFIGIDAPDFNLGVERWLKRRGIRTIHYVSPSIWAWREGRAARIGASADCVLCLFPMEPPIYARHAVDARFVGHPMADEIVLQPQREPARAALGLSRQAPVLALLPGSRQGEITRMLPIFLQAAQRLATRMPDLRILIPAADPACRRRIDSLLGQAPGLSCTVLDGQARQAMIASDVVLLASGTAALEGMLAKRPLVIGHRISPTTYHLVHWLGLLKTRFVSLPNILADEALVPELLQQQCTADNLADAVLYWFENPNAVAALIPRFHAIHRRLRRQAAQRAADAVLEHLPPPSC